MALYFVLAFGRLSETPETIPRIYASSMMISTVCKSSVIICLSCSSHQLRLSSWESSDHQVGLGVSQAYRGGGAGVEGEIVGRHPITKDGAS